MYKHLKNILLTITLFSPGLLNAQISSQQDTTKPIALKGAVITAHNDFIKAGKSGFVVTISGNIETRGKETVEVLKQLPTLHVSDNTLNMTGKSSVIVYVNDRPVHLGGRTLLSYLNSLPSEIIKSVEIISTPPAKYDAAGNIGIINIITKKNISPGWKGSIKGGYGLSKYSSYAGAAYTAYNGKKFFFDGTSSYEDITYLNRTKYYSCYPNETVTTFNPKKWSYSKAEATLNFGYDFSNKSTLILDLKIPLYNKETIADIENRTRFINATTNKTDSTLFSNGNTLKRTNTFNSGLYFRHRFNNKSNFTLSVNYLNNHARTGRNFSSSSMTNDISSPKENYISCGRMDYNITTSKADFEYPLFGCRADAGFKLSFINTNSDNELSGNAEASDTFKYDENVQALYLSMKKDIRQFLKYERKAFK
jgi:hypothetical protein